jgi:glycolate oxidase FAD binding subunit
MRAVASEGALRPVGGGTKLSWGRTPEPVAAEVSTASLARLVEHNRADLTAVVQAGARLGDLQENLAEAGQMLALDPPLGAGEAATVGGVVAAGDSGPLRHRYGAARDLLLGIQVALADGTLARSGGRVIKNVAGYDLAKLFSGSFGTLGLIVEVVVRLHPLPVDRVTVASRSADAAVLQRVTLAAGAAPLELESLDVRWSDGEGVVLARLAGASAELGAKEVVRLAAEAGADPELEGDDGALWREQRSAQRSEQGAAVRVSGLATELARVARCASRVGARAVGRAGLGLFWLTLERADATDLAAAIDEVRADMAPRPCVVLDAPAEVAARVDPWGEPRGPELELMRSVKARFDPQHRCSPGVFVGGI